MTQTSKLTVRIETQYLEAAKRYAAQRRTSLSRLISEYLRVITTQEEPFSQTPILRRLTGILPADVSIDEHKDYLMEVQKSTRHSKITGDFGESLVLYWLSKHSFECACVDHTGIDLIAKNPHTDEVMGISVKSRSRNPGKETAYINIPNDNLDKVRSACEAFGCVPYFAIVVDAADLIRVFITSLDHLVELFPPAKTSVGWKMKPSHLERYYSDPRITIFELSTTTRRWWK